MAPFENWFYSARYRPPRTIEGVKETLIALVTFSFVPHNFGVHGKVPVFGFLFTTLTVAVPFVRNLKLWALCIGTYSALFVWYWLHHFDRYLQIILPWMVVVVVAVSILVWRRYKLARVPLVALLALQVVWGGDVPFIPSHSMMRVASPKATVDILASGYLKKREQRLSPFKAYSEIGATLPADAVTLVHEEHLSLGLRTKRVSDWMGTQGGISYGALESPTQVHALLSKLKVTHIFHSNKGAKGYASLASDLLFYDLLEQASGERRRFSSFSVTRLPPSAPPSPGAALQVALFNCGRGFVSGVYDIGQLNRSPLAKTTAYSSPRKSLALDASATDLAGIRYAVTFQGCKKSPKLNQKGFKQLVRRPQEVLWVTKP